MSVVAFKQRTGSPVAKSATYRAMLSDTVDLLRSMKYADDASRVAAEAQIEAIDEILTE